MNKQNRLPNNRAAGWARRDFLKVSAAATRIGAYREALAKILVNQPIQLLPHEQIIGKLEEAGKTFKVLIIKTPPTKPYTSVFFQLECGYWNAESERQLRDAMK